jgi:hypothetical protein
MVRAWPSILGAPFISVASPDPALESSAET